jgi:NitT/TauT family transport system substrate-binding protein
MRLRAVDAPARPARKHAWAGGVRPGRRRAVVILAVAIGAAALALGAVAGVAGASAAGSGQLKPVTLMLQWTPQSQFAGYYMAKEKGFYAEHGLDVTIIRGGPDRDQLEYLTTGKTDFMTQFLTGAIMYRDQGVPVVNLTQVVNRSNLMLIARAGAGISTIHDLQGKRISIWGEPFRAAYLGWLSSQKTSAEILAQNTSVNLFLRGGADACAAMYYNEYDLIYEAGIDRDQIVPFFLRDHGFNFPEDGIYCLDALAQSDPDACRAMAEASLEGWRYAKEHEEETLDVVMARVEEAHVATNRTHQKWMLETILGSIIPPHGTEWRMGDLLASDYQTAADTLYAQGLIDKPPVAFALFRPLDATE